MKKVLQKQPAQTTRGILSLFLFLLLSASGYSQNAGISPTGAVAPNAAAGLDVNFTNKGMLIPRLALTSTTDATPLAAHVAGMLVYNTATSGDVKPGLYFDNGSKWFSTILQDGTVAGNMQYWDATAGTWVNIVPGTAGQKLTVSALGVPEWSN